MKGKDQEEGPKTKWINQIRKDIEMRGENWEEIEDKGSGRRDCWRFLCYSGPKYFEST